MSTLGGAAGMESLLRRGRHLEYLTLAWNSVEALVSILAGLFAGSIALVGFGLDSVIECLSGAVLLWRLRGGEKGQQRELRALRLVGASFLLLAAYVAADAIHSLWAGQQPESSLFGIGIAALSLMVMPWLARAKRKVAVRLKSQALAADSRQTDLCAYMSAILLGGLLLNTAAGWWWADPIAALVMTPIIIREGVEALRGKTCTDCHCTGSMEFRA